MKKLLSLALALMLIAGVFAVYAESVDHPRSAELPTLTVEESKAVTDNPFLAHYAKDYKSSLARPEQDYYENIDTYLQFKNAPAPYLYSTLGSMFEFVAGKFVMGSYLLSLDLISIEDLLNRFNLLYAEMGRRELLLEGIDAVLPENLVDAARLAEADGNPLEALDNTTVFNNLQFTLRLLQEKQFVTEEQAAAILKLLKRK